MNMRLYQVVNRNLVDRGNITVPDDLRDHDLWLFQNGYGRDYTLRRGIVDDSFDPAIHIEAERLKRIGKLPSILDRIVE